MENTIVKIQGIPNGPLMAEGKFVIVKKDGSSETKEGKAFLCRCGHSGNKPMCDGSHKVKGFKD